MNSNCYNILLVDDDLVQIDLTRRAAVEFSSGITVTAVSGGDAALDWFSANIDKKVQMPHIILLDLKLPKLDGLAVLRTLRGYAATCDIPILVFSAEYTQDDVLMSYKAGANSFEVKPTDLEQLAEFFRERMSYWMHPQQRKLIFAAKDGA
jgi:two-component system response regulator